jgi:hypothetical protein
MWQTGIHMETEIIFTCVTANILHLEICFKARNEIRLMLYYVPIFYELFNKHTRFC